MFSQILRRQTANCPRLVTSSQKCHSDSGSSNPPINSNFVNRNPRSMELLRLARKPRGYCLDSPTVNYWYRLEIEESAKYFSGNVMHHTGTKVLTASTQEWVIRKHLFSAIDVSSAYNIGKILARRCLQMGLLEVHSELVERRDTSEKINRFLGAFEEIGIQLHESSQINARETYSNSRVIPTFPWEVTEEEALRYEEHSENKKIK